MTEDSKFTGKYTQAQLRQLLGEVQNQGRQYLNIGAELRRDGAWIVDWTNEIQKVVPFVPSDSQELDEIYSHTKRLSDHLANYLPQLSALSSAAATGTAFHTSGTVTSALFVFSEPRLAQLTPLEQQTLSEVKQNLYEFSNRQWFKEQAFEQMCRFGFEKTVGGRKAIHQLNAAWETHLQQPYTITSSLIPIREAVNITIGELIRLRPDQRPAGSQKIIEIGNQLSANYANPTDFERMQEDWNVLSNQLSGTKHGSGDRDVERELIKRATLLIVRLLTALDPNKLRP